MECSPLMEAKRLANLASHQWDQLSLVTHQTYFL